MEDLLEEIDSYKFSNLDDVIEFELNGVIEKESNKAYTLDNMMLCVSCLDYTTLKVSDTEDSVRNFATDLCKKTKRYRLPKGCISGWFGAFQENKKSMIEIGRASCRERV